ncbi:MAG: hypothetical protein O4805_01900 [Trichodesmium sp. St16_bin2-tuft]|nr:hypothetical protein [Trichodesmium sp. St18_bin1]MDE5085962.1 hypothetical protein [Trichodesmium sp. St16_bin2-tuft]MDE5107656.1 hypothetical protein [Trichodesmium sp. St17_bin3_1_1]MDE5123773.1 hypothetical protein [Trichodesmium sp. St19_bin1]
METQIVSTNVQDIEQINSLKQYITTVKPCSVSLSFYPTYIFYCLKEYETKIFNKMKYNQGMASSFLDIDSGLDWIYEFPESKWHKTDTNYLANLDRHFCGSESFS